MFIETLDTNHGVSLLSKELTDGSKVFTIHIESTRLEMGSEIEAKTAFGEITFQFSQAVEIRNKTGRS